MLKDLLIPKHIDNKIRWGVNKDGGYVLSSHFSTVSQLISCGCDNQTSFEEDYLKHNPSGKINIYDTKNTCDLAQKNHNVQFYNNKVVSIDQLNISEPCIVQMDIEGSEYDILSNYAGNFSNIVQFIVEFHFIYAGDLAGWETILTKLNKYFYLIHIHANNCVQSKKYSPVPDVIECTYLNKNLLNTTLDNDNVSYPTKGLDYRNCPHKPELILNWWINE